MEYMARPLQEYSLSEECQREACRLAAEGKSIQAICEAIFVSEYYFWQYRLQDAEFACVFAKCRDAGLDSLADQLIGITEKIPDVQKARLESENARWLLSKRKPATYGDRVAVDVTHTVNLPAALAEARQRAATRPIRDLSTGEKTEILEFPEKHLPAATGCEPVASLISPAAGGLELGQPEAVPAAECQNASILAGNGPPSDAERPALVGERLGAATRQNGISAEINGSVPPTARKRGRPKGSKNKARTEAVDPLS